MQAIPTYQNYYTKNNVLYGISEEPLCKIDLIDETENRTIKLQDFFVKNDDFYLSISQTDIIIGTDNTDPKNPVETRTPETSEVFYKQSNGEIETVKAWPKKPVVSRSQLDNSDFSISNYDYEGKMCSDVKNISTESGTERFFMVDGYSYFSGVGLFFNVSDGRYDKHEDGTVNHMVRDKGLYYWPVGMKNISTIKSGDGILW